MIGTNIRRYRKIKGFNLRDLSEKSGVGKTTISELENNKSNPSIETLGKIAKALDVPVSSLLDEDTVNKTAVEIDAEMQEYYEKISNLPREEKDFIKKMLKKVLD